MRKWCWWFRQVSQKIDVTSSSSSGLELSGLAADAALARAVRGSEWRRSSTTNLRQAAAYLRQHTLHSSQSARPWSSPLWLSADTNSLHAPYTARLAHCATMDLSESQTTFPSDSENYDANYDANHSNSQDSEEQASSSSSPLILYSPPTFLSILRGAAINLVLPFINGLMLGFGELFAHEAAFRLGWGGTRVSLANRRVNEEDPGTRQAKLRRGNAMDMN